MEKQRSFSIKPTRLWLFSFTISFSLIFLIFFSIWVLNLPLSTPQDPHLHFNTTTSIPLYLKPIFKIQILGSFHRSYSATQIENSILVGTHFSIVENESQISNISASEGISEKESERKLVTQISTVLFGLKNSTFFGNCSTKSETVSEVLQIEQNASFPLYKKLEGEASSDIVPKQVCDITKGKWVFDENYPLYTNASCPYIDEGLVVNLMEDWTRII